eukprot:GILJ01020281.1.p1 GENE.GILJ01020281.1~~GILJ01020281.1.p1  ORF type:complete len:302 (+),score=34.15 GILJ01020281.1:150-1055(+)
MVSISSPNDTFYRLSNSGPMSIIVATIVFLAFTAIEVDAATPPLDKNSLHALSGHIFVGSITQIQSKPYTDPSNDEWKETHFLVTVKVTAVLKTAKHTNSLSGDFDFASKMSTSFDESVTIGSEVGVITSSIVSLPKGWSGDVGNDSQLLKGEVHTFYCTHLGKRRFQFDTTFPFSSGKAAVNAQDATTRQIDSNNKHISSSTVPQFTSQTPSAYLALSPNGIGPVISHDDIIHDAMVTPAELFQVLDKSALDGADRDLAKEVSTIRTGNGTNETNHNTTPLDGDDSAEEKASEDSPSSEL